MSAGEKLLTAHHDRLEGLRPDDLRDLIAGIVRTVVIAEHSLDLSFPDGAPGAVFVREETERLLRSYGLLPRV